MDPTKKEGGKVTTKRQHPNFTREDMDALRTFTEHHRGQRSTIPRVVQDALAHEDDVAPPPARRRRMHEPIRHLESDDVPAALYNENRVNNLYIYPKEMVDFLFSEHVINRHGMVELDRLATVFDMIKRYPDNVEEERRNFFAQASNRTAYPEDFVRFELTRFLTNDFGVVGRMNIWPHLSGPTHRKKLAIPCSDVRDLSLYVMFYILYNLVYNIAPNAANITYTIESNALDIEKGTEFPVYDQDGRPIHVVGGKISLDDLLELYVSIIKNFAHELPEEGPADFSVTWNGSDESGTRVRLLNWGRPGSQNMVYLSMKVLPAQSVRRGFHWTQEVEDLIANTVGRCVISVRNRIDNKCLLYCIILGLFIKIKQGTSRVFGTSSFMIEASEIYAKASYMFTGQDDEISVLLRRLSLCLMAPTYSSGPVDPLIAFVEELDRRATTMMSISGFRKEFEEIERTLIPNNICGIDVYGMDFNINRHIYPLYISKNREKVIELLCITPKQAGFSHYCLITNSEKLFQRTGGKQFFSCTKCGECFYHRRLLREHQCEQLDGNVGGYHYSNKTANNPNLDPVVGYCTKCRLMFTNEFEYNYHKEHCLMKGMSGYRHVQLVTYDENEHPTLNGVELDMENENKHVKQRRVMYADFESSINPETGVHTFMSYGIYDWNSDNYECGYDLEDFFNYIVEKALEGSEDHIYVYFHNAMGYDANFILRYVLKSPSCANWGINVIMKSSNRLQKLVFYLNEHHKVIHICDTFMFLTLSLEKIVGSIRKDNLETNQENFARFFHIFKERYPDVSDEEIDHILRKNIFPYKFFTNSEKLVTPIDEFLKIFEAREENLKYFSERVTLEELRNGYEDTKHVIETFGCKNACEYHDLYLCCDVMQLADVFDRSMNILWESHHIHLTRYLGMPSASWAAFLRHDPTMKIPLYENTFFAEFFKGMIRGGITSAALRYAKADETHSIIYLDVNGLYPYVMQAYKYPCGKFEYVAMGYTGEQCKPRLYELFDKFERVGDRGMCFCVDMHIPDSVKELTDMYPFAPEHRRIFNEYFDDVESKELTPFLKRWSEANNGEMMSEFNGLVCTLYDKTKYNVHWRLLKFYMDHGVEITKVWFGVAFDEGDYLAGYIRKNIEIRNTRKDELGKTLYKLLGNSVYGKTFESPFKRNTYEIVRDPVKMQGLLNEGNIAAMTPIDELGWIVKMDGEDIVLDKPTYIGACVCEFSKLHMYTLLYDKLMKIFPGSPTEKGCELVYTDTDSFIVRVKHPEGVPGFNPTALFDYIKSCDPTLIGGIGGQVKSETGEDDTIKKVIALRSKVYAYKTLHGHLGKRAKGTTHDAQEMRLSWESYKTTWRDLTSLDTDNTQFLRSTFQIASVDISRRSLSVNDGKRYICEDGIHTHAFGYPLK